MGDRGFWTTFFLSFVTRTCHPDCFECLGPLATQCQACGQNAELQSSGSCRCLPGFCAKPDAMHCEEDCDSSCLLCSGCGADQCLVCASHTAKLVDGECHEDISDGQDWELGRPLQARRLEDWEMKAKAVWKRETKVEERRLDDTDDSCDSTCVTCGGSSVSDCFSCHSQAHVLEPAPGLCVCDDGFYPLPDTSNCQPCHPSCGTCLGSSSSDCSSCLNFAQLSGLSPNSCLCVQSAYPAPDVQHCVPCAAACFTCQDASAANCLSCYQGARLTSPAPSSCECGEGYFANLDAANCAPCDDMCLTCSSPAICLSCKQNAELQADSSCVCSAGHYGDPGHCASCSTGCQVCNAAGCIACMPQWLLYIRECVSSCPVGYTAQDLECIEGDYSPPEPLMEVNFDNSLTISFSQPIHMNLTVADMSIEVTDLDSVVYPTNWSEPLVLNHSSFLLQLLPNDTDFPYDNLCLLTFLRPSTVVSLHAVALVKDQLTGTLHGKNETTASNQNITLLRTAATAVAKGTIGAAAVSSILNANPGSFWSLLNQIQLMTYIPMTKMPVPEGLMAVLGSLDAGSFVPNPFSYVLPANSSSQTPPDYARRYEVDSALFLLNTGLSMTSGLGLFLGLLPIYMASRVTSGPLSLYIRRFLPSFKWGIPLRWWLQSYLDIAIYSFLQVQQVLTHSGISEVLIGLNFVLSGLFALITLLSPVLSYMFLWRNYKRMASRQDSNFNQRWGVLYAEFDPKQEIGGLIYYPLFLTRRLIYALTIICLYDYPETQALVNISLAVATVLYVLTCKPSPMWIDQFSCVVGEISILAVFSLSCVFFLPLSQDSLGKVEIIAVWTVLGAIGANAVLSALASLYTVLTIFREYRKQTGKTVRNLSKVKPEMEGKQLSLQTVDKKAA